MSTHLNVQKQCCKEEWDKTSPKVRDWRSHAENDGNVASTSYWIKQHIQLLSQDYIKDGCRYRGIIHWVGKSETEEKQFVCHKFLPWIIFLLDSKINQNLQNGLHALRTSWNKWINQPGRGLLRVSNQDAYISKKVWRVETQRWLCPSLLMTDVHWCSVGVLAI